MAGKKGKKSNIFKWVFRYITLFFTGFVIITWFDALNDVLKQYVPYTKVLVITSFIIIAMWLTGFGGYVWNLLLGQLGKSRR